MWRALLFPLLLAPHLIAACQCVIQLGVCDEVHQSDAVFVGTVESVAPPFLDPYTRPKVMASLPAGETARLQSDASPEAIEKLKKIYLEMFSGIPDQVRQQIVRASTQHDLQTAFESVQSEGRLARFRVRTLYKHGDDDDDKEAPEFLDVWTGGGDCGIDFQVGETYLVYAIEDEASGKLETSVCMRTRRLSEERGDLGYLYFFQNARKESGRIEGFVSSSFADQNLPRYENSVGFPAVGALLELDPGVAARYVQSDREGRFAFDGLGAGDYKLSLLEPGFPKTARIVVLSRSFHMDESGCVRQILVVPAQVSR